MTTIIAKYGMKEMNYGIVVYGATASSFLQLRDRVPNEFTLRKIIQSVSPASGQPSLSKGLAEAKRLFDGSSRKDARRILVVITDTRTGTDKEAIQQQMSLLTGRGVHVIPVAIGNDAFGDLNQDIGGEDVIVVDRDDRAKKIAKVIMRNVTSGK